MTGESPAFREGTGSSRPMVAATYNVHGWTGRDSRQIPQRCLRVIQEMNCDVVGLQEATFSLESGKKFTAGYLREMTGMEPVLGPTLYRAPWHFGNVLLTRFPVLRARRFDLTVRPFEPRGVLDVDILFRDLEVRVLVTHLGLRVRERRSQLKSLLERLNPPDDRFIILMGDFNVWFLPRRAYRNMHALFGFPPAPRTYPAAFPLLAFDRIWVHPPSALRNVTVWRSGGSREASDHLPVRADLSLERRPVAEKGTIPAGMFP